MRRGLQGSQAPRNAFAEHHPILDVGVRCFRACRELNHRVRLVCHAQTERVDSNPGAWLATFTPALIRTSGNSGGPTLQLPPLTRRNPHSPRPMLTNR